MNEMRNIRVEKITLNVGAGKDPGRLEKGIKLLQNLTEIKPIKTVTKKRIPTWGLRPGLPIGCKLTLRKKKATEILKRLVQAKNNRLKESQVDGEGNLAFGIHEYIDVPGASYDPEIGIMGFEVCVTLERKGFRIKRRRLIRKKIPRTHKISKKEAMEFMKEEFKVSFGGEE